MKKQLIFIIITALASGWSSLCAQDIKTIVLQGQVVDSVSKKPIEGAVVQWVDSLGEKVAGSITSPTGRFELKGNNPKTNGNLYIQSTGYAVVRIPLSNGDLSGHGELGILYLHSLYHGLKEVTITAQKQAYRIEPDKRVFDVESSLSAKGGTVAEVFRQVPGVTISPSGKLTLRNSTPALLVDGKRTDLTLDQIPADEVASIEIITNPSAKYDASGNSGIINIIMKKDRKQGLHGLVNVNRNTIPEYNAYGELGVSGKKVRLTVSYLQHGHQSKNDETLKQQDIATGISLMQQGKSFTKGPFQKGRVVFDYLPDEHNAFSLSANIGGGDFKTVNNMTASYFGKTGRLDSSGIRNTVNESDFRFAEASLNYTHHFAQPEEQLTTELYLEKYKGPSVGTYQMQYHDEDGPALGSPVLQQYDGGIHAHTIILRSDYSKPLRSGKARLEAGFKINLHKDHNQNLMEDYDLATEKYETNTAATYNFHYKDPTYAAYGSYSDRYGRFSYMAGLRFEQYDYSGEMTDSLTKITYRNPGIYPSLFLTEKIGKSSELHLNYSRRVNRPGFDEISPFTDYSNPQNLFRGNPDLQSEHTNLAEFTYNTLLGPVSLIGTLYLRNITDAITTYTTSIAADTLITTYINANHNNSYGAELMAKIPLSNWWNVTANANLFDTRIAATDLAGGISNNGISWLAKFNTDMNLPADMEIQLSAVYEAPKIIPQGRTLSSGYVDIAAGKKFLKNKNLMLTLSMTDVFNSDRNWSSTALKGQFARKDMQKYLTRVLKVNINYQFGSKGKKALKHINETSKYEGP